MANRNTRKEIAKETLQILDTGSYVTPAGNQTSIANDIAYATLNSIAYSPNELNVLTSRDPQWLEQLQFDTTFEVRNETTITAAKRLQDQGQSNVVCLNFASAKNPGGGFLGGSQAQEEALCRASALYGCLKRFPKHYSYHRNHPNCLYSDRMIYSPNVPVFRDSDDLLLEESYKVSVITAPAVNAGCVKHSYQEHIVEIESTMTSRIEKVLALAASQGHESIILGAWGCGVFRNDPCDVAHWFAKHLKGGQFGRVFNNVVFAIKDATKDQRFIAPFKERFIECQRSYV
jgi:uncharacterized protein (TIGR02452 family)